VHRDHLLRLIDLYAAAYPGELEVAERLRSFVAEHPDCFRRTCAPGHVTGSAWIVSADHERVLLTHHRKLGRWLQLGGHSDGDPDPLRVALREAQEESGLARFAPVATGRDIIPVDLDIHEIPARGDEPAHLHYDVRYLLVAAPGQTIAISDESNDLRWIERNRLHELTTEESQLRMESKARRLAPLRSRSGG
jgi:8-oxo-dGTP pyrophosphatase MutT (NUDIX family)